MVERNGRSTSKRIMNVDGRTLKKALRQTVDKSSTIMTDEWKSYGERTNDAIKNAQGKRLIYSQAGV